MKKTFYRYLALITCAASLSACTNMVSEGINDAGIASTVIFPTTDTAWNPEGIFPNVNNVRQIAPGVTKDDLYYLLGRPHFKEMHGAREWDYIFKFRDGLDKPVSTCQYKVIFDKNKRGQSFHWQPRACAERFYQTLTDLSADALFPFNRSASTDISATGKSLLRQLADKVKQAHAGAKIHIIGHTDYLGSSAYNQRLSQRRADSVKRYLVQQGVNSQQMVAVGKGESDPAVTCDNSKQHDELVKCLAPNRRVSIIVAPH